MDATALTVDAPWTTGDDRAPRLNCPEELVGTRRLPALFTLTGVEGSVAEGSAAEGSAFPASSRSASN